MFNRSSILLSAITSGLIAASSPVSAASVGPSGPFARGASSAGALHRVHDAGQVVHELRSKGYYRIDVIDPYLPKIQVDACKDGVRWHLHANYYGDIYHREHAGSCDGGRGREYSRGYGNGYGNGYAPRRHSGRDGWDY